MRRILTRETWYVSLTIWTAGWIITSLFKGDLDSGGMGSCFAIAFLPLVMDVDDSDDSGGGK